MTFLQYLVLAGSTGAPNNTCIHDKQACGCRDNSWSLQIVPEALGCYTYPLTVLRPISISLASYKASLMFTSAPSRLRLTQQPCLLQI